MICNKRVVVSLALRKTFERDIRSMLGTHGARPIQFVEEPLHGRTTHCCVALHGLIAITAVY